MCDNGTLIPCRELYRATLDQWQMCEACESELSILSRSWNGQVRRMIATGSIDPTCERCQREVMALEHPAHAFHPNHAGSRYCQSGSIASGGHRAHCTCDTCF